MEGEKEDRGGTRLCSWKYKQISAWPVDIYGLWRSLASIPGTNKVFCRGWRVGRYPLIQLVSRWDTVSGRDMDSFMSFSRSSRSFGLESDQGCINNLFGFLLN